MILHQKEEIGLQQSVLMDKLAARKRRRKATVKESDEDEDTDTTKQKPPAEGEDMGKLLGDAKDMVDDSNMMTQRKLEIGEQQRNLMDRLERRKKRIVDNKGSEALALSEELNPHDQEDLSDLLKVAKGMIENQDMLSTRQNQVDEQQSDLMKKLALRRAKSKQQPPVLNQGTVQNLMLELDQIGQRNVDEEDFDALLQQAVGLVDDQQLLNDRKRELELQSQKMMEQMGKKKLAEKKELYRKRLTQLPFDKESLNKALHDAAAMVHENTLYGVRRDDINN